MYMLACQISVLLTTVVKFGVLAFQGVDFFFAVIKKLPRKQFSLNSFVKKAHSYGRNAATDQC